MLNNQASLAWLHWGKGCWTHFHKAVATTEKHTALNLILNVTAALKRYLAGSEKFQWRGLTAAL